MYKLFLAEAQSKRSKTNLHEGHEDHEGLKKDSIGCGVLTLLILVSF